MIRNDCPFCSINPSLVLCANKVGLAIRDRFPVSLGHSLVMPFIHTNSIFDLPDQDQQILWELVIQLRKEIMVEFNPIAFNIGINDGLAAGQTVPHAHIHVIPRYNNDKADPRGGIRWVIPKKAPYWKE
ncbi:MAG: HIT family protein [bacterium]